MPDLMTPAQVRSLLSVSDRTLFRWANDRTLVPVKLPGGQRRYRAEDVQALINKPQG